MFAGTHAYFTMEESRTCSVNYFCFGALLIFIGSILLCSFGFTIVLPFERTKYWPEVTCRVVKAEVNQSLCACEEQGLAYPGCSKFSPCLQVIIAYNATYGKEYEQLVATVSTTSFSQGSTITSVEDTGDKVSAGNHRNVANMVVKRKSDQERLDHSISIRTNLTGGIERTQLVHGEGHSVVDGDGGGGGIWGSDWTTTSSGTGRRKQEVKIVDNYRQAMLFRSWGDVFYTHCTLQECGDESWNDKETRRFKAKWGDTGQIFPCYVDPIHPDTVILTRTSFWSMLHAILWPSTCLFVGIILWVGLCCGCWSLDSESTTSAYYGVL